MSIQLKTIGVVAKNLSKTLDFYRALGLEIPDISEEGGNVDVELSNGIVLGFLSLDVAMQNDPNYKENDGQSLNLQFECDAANEVDTIYNKILNVGYASYSEPWDAFWGQRFARVMDPDGRVVNIYADI